MHPGRKSFEIRVLFDEREDGSVGVRLTDGDNQSLGIARSFTPSWEDKDYEDLRWYLEEFMDMPDGGAVTRARAIEKEIKEWGQTLYQAVFGADENRQVLKQLLKAPEPRELTIATDRLSLLRLPWELMADEAGSLAQRVSVRRQLVEKADADETDTRQVELPLRMLYIISRPQDAGFIDPRLTTRALLAALDPLGSSVQLDFCRPPTVHQMEEMLRDAQANGKPYDVVHFDGHGTFLQEAQIGALCFEKTGDGESETDFVRADRLGDLLAKYEIPLVVLEACRSATMGKTMVFRSVAPRLIQAGVGSVLSMSHAVHVEAARILLDRFYRELVRGTTIGHAVAQGRSALVSTPSRWIEYGPRGRTIALNDWFLPHLYQRDDDKNLFPKSTGEQPIRQFDLFLSHNHNDSERVESLARTLVEKHGLRVWLDKWECGPGQLESQCEAGIRDSRFTVVVGSQTALNSKWVAWEIDKHNELNPEGDRLIPIKFEPLALPEDLQGLLWVDFTDPSADAQNAELLSRLIRSADAEDARRRLGFRLPAQAGETGAFPRSPRFGFHGRARELYDLERTLRRHRGIVLHAMGGMGKTTLATEAAHWWTRSGLFRDGACFVSFEQFANADRVISVLGEYCEGPKFHQRPAAEQRRRAIEFFQERDVLMVWDNYESTLPQFNTEVSGKALAAGSDAAHNSSPDASALPLTSATPYTEEVRRELADLFRDLTSGPGRGSILVTCRPGETGLPDPRRCELHGLARPDSLWLLQQILERDGLSLDDEPFGRDKLDPLLDDLADHPLSLELVGPHLKRLTPEEIRDDFANLLTTMKQDADETRNQSLLASLEFSRRHLSEPAREALRWLGLFSGGVFEQHLLAVSQLELAELGPIRDELQSIALLRILDDYSSPFLRFHPTLAIASADRTLAEDPATRERYVGVYRAVRQMLDKMLTGSQSRAALEILSREEANYRTAVRWAVEDNQHQAAAALGDTFSTYLQMSGRLRERDAWVEWLHGEVIAVGFTEDAADYERQQAWTRLTSGDPQGAVDQLQQLIERLRQTTEFAPAFQLATATLTLGRVLHNAGASAQAIPILREAIGHWETLVEQAAGQPWAEAIEAQARRLPHTELGNLSATMGDLANALRANGEHDEALAVAEKGLTIDQARGNQREVAASHTQCAQILMAAGRYDEADARYDQALGAARRAGDKQLEGSTLQHQGILADNRNQLSRATTLYQQALQRFQEAGDLGAIMRTYNLLGVTDQKADLLAAARAWYEKSREMAKQLQNQVGLGQAAQNIGIVWQNEGEAARAAGDESAARQSFEQARLALKESLRVKQALNNKPKEALAHGQLARIHLLLDDLDSAERHAHAAREIRESLGLKEVHIDYHTLSEIAQARGDTNAAAEWAQKRDDKREQLKQLAGGGGGLPGQLVKACEALMLACVRAGLDGEELGADEEEALSQLEKLSGGMAEFAQFLRQLAASGKVPAIPDTLPPELQSLVQGLVQALQES